MVFRKWGKSKHFHKHKSCLQNNYLKYSVKLGENRRFSFQLVTMVLMVYKRTAHSLFSPPRHAPEPSASPPVSSRPPPAPISYAITGPEATLVTPLLAGPHSVLQGCWETAGQGSGTNLEVQSVGTTQAAGRAWLPSARQARRQRDLAAGAENRGPVCSGWGAQGLFPPSTLAVFPSG